MASITLFYIFSSIVIAGTLLSFYRATGWWIRAFDFPRPHLAFVGLLAVVTFWIIPEKETVHWILLAGTVVCAFYPMMRILPYTPVFPVEVFRSTTSDPANEISILVSNVLQSNTRYENLIRLVKTHAPDLVLTLETDEKWEDALRPMYEDYPYKIAQPQDNLYGMHLNSRLPLRNPNVLFLVKDEIPSLHVGVEMASGQTVELYCLHPEPPSPTENPTSTERDAELLIVAKLVKQSNHPTIVAGDLNDVAWSGTTRLFRKVSGLLDPRIGRGMYNTFHARYPFLRWPLDHVFHSKAFALKSIRRLPGIGSDHFPILIRLQLRLGAKRAQSEPRATSSDHKQAGQKIQKAFKG